MTHKLGAVVYLNSGGPAMTIADSKGWEPSEYHCVWFDVDDHVFSEWFSSNMITAEKPTQFGFRKGPEE